MRVPVNQQKINDIPYLFAYKPISAISRDPKLLGIHGSSLAKRSSEPLQCQQNERRWAVMYPELENPLGATT